MRTEQGGAGSEPRGVSPGSALRYRLGNTTTEQQSRTEAGGGSQFLPKVLEKIFFILLVTH